MTVLNNVLKRQMRYDDFIIIYSFDSIMVQLHHIYESCLPMHLESPLILPLLPLLSPGGHNIFSIDRKSIFFFLKISLVHNQQSLPATTTAKVSFHPQLG